MCEKTPFEFSNPQDLIDKMNQRERDMIKNSLNETHWFCETCQVWVIKNRPCPRCGSFGGGK
jgi:hypothetical protein